jgi:hypothetical protein
MAKFMDVYSGFVGVTGPQLKVAQRPNPSGVFNDRSPKVSCRGQGDPA